MSPQPVQPRYAEQISNETHATSIGALELDLVMGHVKLAGQPVHLTNLEFRVLSYLIQHAGRVVSTSELLQAAWKYRPGASGTSDQVRSCIKRLRQKIELDSRHPTFIMTALGGGYFVPSRIEPR